MIFSLGHKILLVWQFVRLNRMYSAEFTEETPHSLILQLCCSYDDFHIPSKVFVFCYILYPDRKPVFYLEELDNAVASYSDFVVRDGEWTLFYLLCTLVNIVFSFFASCFTFLCVCVWFWHLGVWYRHASLRASSGCRPKFIWLDLIKHASDTSSIILYGITLKHSISAHLSSFTAPAMNTVLRNSTKSV